MSQNESKGSSVDEIQKALSLALGQVRTEQLEAGELFEMFSKPVYWAKLVGKRPCMLIGGRGTGKTTTLRGLSFEGQSKLSGLDISDWTAIGAYWRIESNVVTAFRGRKIAEDKWIRIFSHYVNLQMLSKILDFVDWRRSELSVDTKFEESALSLVGISLTIDDPKNLQELSLSIDREIAFLEAKINGATRELEDMKNSALGKPVEYLLRSLRADSDLENLTFTFCIDEFENLEPYQQRVINTLVKHVGDSGFTFKIGVRSTVRRERNTLVEDQPLVDPADYATIDIVDHLKEQSFSNFAAKICESRLKRLPESYRPRIDILQLLPDLAESDEALMLGADSLILEIRSDLVAQGASLVQLQTFDAMSIASACLVDYWSKTQGVSKLAMLVEAISDPGKWKTRANNYSYAMLFTYKRGKRGLKKYYCGWSTYISICDGNIRYALRLVYEALILHTADKRDLSEPVSPEIQTDAAMRVGDMSLRELQGLSASGAQLMRLNLSLGRIYGVMAAEPQGHTPEVNQFRVTRNDINSDDVDRLLDSAIMHGALTSFAGDKQARNSGETKQNDYQLHPIFSPYFQYSHRRKRRMNIAAGDFLELAGPNARRSIEKILRSRVSNEVVELPEQLSIYSGFYNE
ncbi:ORC-CDC6 family AAA ATPase [Rhodococcus globerulus]|uniref:Uncharacterized protein n=1 Tax=Rhodococcus globerulus TaxID=33008 RepID=A0ABU4BPE6_RHOGO|nr:hypothetical protein [Rhodococcus globerulus]MDV6266070.1 hypothetical protein [Rhodococcus globerulus]